MASIGLVMIVKNEAKVIRRCLSSVLPLLDYVLIADTGSTDGTQDLIRAFLREQQLPGQVLDEPWQNFAANRNSVLAKLRGRTEIDYALMIDADEVLVFASDFDCTAFKNSLSAPVYDIPTHFNGLIYNRPQLFSNRLPLVYKAVLHEYLDCADLSRALVGGFFNQPTTDGVRSQNPDKFRADATLLEQALQTETDPFLISRYTFYLAQSYWDIGELERAAETYLRRAQQGFWQQEVTVSLYNAAHLKEVLGYPPEELLTLYLRAFEACPNRAEALHGVMRLCHTLGKYQQGYVFGKHALTLSNPPDALFAKQWLYDYGLLDEFAITAYWAGHYQESLAACQQLLADKRIPAEHWPRIRANAGFAIAKLNQPELRGLLPS
ncbi:glycosyltransferase [Methylovulum psychrotolerans]|uniref:glycosyltransferase n=1 Tax=Methylovulum psychrotolerans TaxID=1704499 RepID=UPI001BFF4636|nr:glycosyltransferase [Methylovulum psychrotolerans]MBT9097280.1 glycosyltransferase [Methylovulum psychrotolerans]